MLTSDVQAKAQAYLTDSLYLNLGVGVATVKDHFGAKYEFKPGFGMSAGLGYQFNITDNVYVAPEARVVYRHVNHREYVTPEGLLLVGFKF